MSKTISARIDETLHNKLKDSCNDEGITVNDKVNQLLDEHLNNSNDDIEKKVEIKESKSSKDDNTNSENQERSILDQLLKAVENRPKQEKKQIKKTTPQSIPKVEQIHNHNKHGLHCCVGNDCNILKLKRHTFS